MTHGVRIFLSLDGTEKDGRALQVADAFAELTGGDLHFVRVVPVPATKTSFGMAMLGLTAAREDLRQDIERSVRDTAERFSSGSRRGGNVTSEVIDGTDVASELLGRAESSADVILMATRAPGTLGRTFFGSVADRVVRDATCPVVVVPPGARYASGKRITLARALVPLDGSRLSAAVIDRMLDVVPTGSLEYVLMQDVHVERIGGYVMPEPTLPVLPGNLGASAPRVIHVQAEHTEKHLNELAARLRQLGESTSVVVSEAGDPARAIHEAIRGELVDLIAMSTRGSGGVTRMLLGSVANAVVRKSEVPVFLATPRSSEKRPR
jgi:nucleotide-binding universal stress UspA family protein